MNPAQIFIASLLGVVVILATIVMFATRRARHQ